MKKNILIFTIILTILFTASCKEKSSKDLFKDFIPKSLSTYEYFIQNPMTNNFYITDLDSIKGKIIKTYSEDYDIHKDGRITYGDGDGKMIGYFYYFFDSEGKEYASYSLTGYDNKNLNTVDTTVENIYEYKESIFISTTTMNRLYNNTKENKSTTYEIKKENNKLYVTELNLNNKYSTIQKIYERDGDKLIIINYPIKKGVIDNYSRTEYVYENDKSISNEYRQGELYRTKENIQGRNVLTINRRPEFMDIWIYKPEGNIINSIYRKEDYNGVIIKEQTQKPTIVKYNSIGIVEESYYGPEIEGTPGTYRKTTTEILDKPDELLLKYFPELKE